MPRLILLFVLCFGCVTTDMSLGSESSDGLPPPRALLLAGRSHSGPQGLKVLAPVTLPEDAPAGNGLLQVEREDGLFAIPIQETRFDVQVVGTVAEITVQQVFVNPFDEPIEAVYVFPLPNKGAVDAYGFWVGDRFVQGKMMRRDEAREVYERARDGGRNAGLLEQERPNIFSQSLANIMPQQVLEAELHIVLPLEQEDGEYALHLPTTVGPRFLPGSPIGQQGSGWSPDTDGVPDASRISPPYVPEGMRTAHDLFVNVSLEAGLEIGNLRSNTHPVEIQKDEEGSFVRLDGEDFVPNKDFELSWSLAGKVPQMSLMSQRDGSGSYFTLTVQPPQSLEAENTVPRELIFVVDNSCSMSGDPMRAAKEAMGKVLRGMNVQDSFQVLRFSENASALSPRPLPNTPENLRKGLRYVGAMRGMGGTFMLAGIEAALDAPEDEDRVRFVLFLTDGYIGNEQEIFDAIDARVGSARLFSLGVGSSVNRYLLDGMARVGRGAVTYLGLDDDPQEAVDSFYERIAHPALTDISIDWGELPVEDVVPSVIPDLFLGQPVTVFGRFIGEAQGKAVLHGRLGKEWVRRSIEIKLVPKEGRGLRSIWARGIVDDLLNDPRLRFQDSAERNATEEEIIGVALAHDVMTAYTAFVAVDEQEIANEAGTWSPVAVPAALPEGVEAMAVSAAAPRVFGSLGGSVGGGGMGYGVSGSGVSGSRGSGPPPPMSPRRAIKRKSPGKRSDRPAVSASPKSSEDVSGREEAEQVDALNGNAFAVHVSLVAESVSGSASEDEVGRALRSVEARLRSCIKQVLSPGSGAERMSLLLDLELDASGVVVSVKLRGEQGLDEELKQCLRKSLRTVKLGPQHGTSQIAVRVRISAS